MYNPGVNDVSGQILGQSMAGAADTRAQGQQALAQGAASGVSSLFQGVMSGVEKYQVDKVEGQELGGKAEFLHQNGILSADQLAKFNEAPLGKKRAIVGTGSTLFDLHMQDQQEEEDYRRKVNFLGMQTAAYGARQTARPEAPVNPAKTPLGMPQIGSGINIWK